MSGIWTGRAGARTNPFAGAGLGGSSGMTNVARLWTAYESVRQRTTLLGFFLSGIATRGGALRLEHRPEGRLLAQRGEIGFLRHLLDGEVTVAAGPLEHPR